MYRDCITEKSKDRFPFCIIIDTTKYLILYRFSCQLQQGQLQQLSTYYMSVLVLFISVNVNDFVTLREVQ